jgi:Ca2+/Na+ antiporter
METNYISKEKRVWLYVQSLTLLGGTVFAWSNAVPQFIDFYKTYGTVFRFQDCAIPNPLATACLYGSLAFLVAFIWSLRILQTTNSTHQKYLKNFLIFCVLFAASVFALEVLEYYTFIPVGTPSISCSPGARPFATPCFYGMLFFIASLASAIVVTREKRYV